MDQRTRKTRRRQPDGTNSGGLPLFVQKNLLKYIEGPAPRHLKTREICDLRPDLFGQPGSTLRKSVQNKVQWFKK
jgi:hypothetical protein